MSLKFLNSNNKNLLLNCGYGNSYSVKKIVSIFQKISEKKFNIKIEKRRKGDVKSIKTKNSMLKKVLKFKPKYNNIYKIVKSCIDWEKIQIMINKISTLYEVLFFDFEKEFKEIFNGAKSIAIVGNSEKLLDKKFWKRN